MIRIMSLALKIKMFNQVRAKNVQWNFTISFNLQIVEGRLKALNSSAFAQSPSSRS